MKLSKVLADFDLYRQRNYEGRDMSQAFAVLDFLDKAGWIAQPDSERAENSGGVAREQGTANTTQGETCSECGTLNLSEYIVVGDKVIGILCGCCKLPPVR